MSSLIVRPKADSNGWEERHNAAINAPRGEECGIVRMIQAWEQYAHKMAAWNGTKVGEDGYCGEYWVSIGESLIKLLSGPIGTRLDCGILDKFIREVAEEYGAEID